MTSHPSRTGCRREWIAVDGPAGAGKSSLARALAKALGYRYIDTGATYRAAALAVLQAGVHPGDPASRSRIVDIVRRVRIRLGTDPRVDLPSRVFLDGRDVSTSIRSLEVGQAASTIATIPEVRRVLAELQRRMAEEGPCVMDGRDIGTVVLKEACVKLYVTASLEERARRRAKELQEIEGQVPVSLEEIEEQLAMRDQQDATRQDAPLRAAEDAVTLDTTGQTPGEVLERALAICRECLGDGG
ncbi:(d)CMP kinase [Carboxydochorda subterranea]|uniref:Cytidylate kinase n=1 Tax=Carboxydichorda subterranea TaxID=3109565 RepID=A0ABZ1C101_9FIRM|nr:(d)CMP kinase [Limnochorda sp. L945t]WRP18558.1 (d)CMP kinase [Limnochorda sp. L945t]